jgi:hypothetical protein
VVVVEVERQGRCAALLRACVILARTRVRQLEGSAKLGAGGVAALHLPLSLFETARRPTTLSLAYKSVLFGGTPCDTLHCSVRLRSPGTPIAHDPRASSPRSSSSMAGM